VGTVHAQALLPPPQDPAIALLAGQDLNAARAIQMQIRWICAMATDFAIQQMGASAFAMMA